MVAIGGERLMLENVGRCLDIEMPKYKKRSVSAVRDFPPGCGPNTSRADFRGNGAVCHSDNAQKVEHSPSDCLEVENTKTSSATESPASSHDVDKFVGTVQKVGELELVRDENAVSEFPEAVNMNTSAAAAEGPSSLQGVDKSMVVVLKAIKLELMNDDSFDSAENLSKSFEPTDMSEELLPRSCSLSETLQVTDESVSKELLHETQGPSKYLTEDKPEIPGVLNKDGKMVSAQEEKMENAVIPFAHVPKEIHYPPRRRVSAVRDFPPGCGTSIHASKKHFPGRPPKSEKQYRMDGLKSNKCVQIDKLKVAYDRKTEKRASNVRDRKEAVVYRNDKGDKKRKLICLGNDTDLYAKRTSSSDHAKGLGIKKGMTAAPNCPKQQGIGTSSCMGAKDIRCEKGIGGKRLKLKLKSRFLEPIKKADEGKEGVVPGKQQEIATSSCMGAKDIRCEKGIGGKKLKLKLKSLFLQPIKKTDEGKEGVVPGKLLRTDGRNSAANGRGQNHLSLMAPSRQVDASLSPVGASSVDGVARNKVRETLRLFQAVVRKLSQEEETNLKGGKQFRRVDLQASVMLKEKGKYSNAGKPIIGHVPGIEVGDEFHYRVELMIIGLHRPPQAGIDSVKVCDWALATSVVDSGGYDNKVDDYDVWVYTGQGGNSTARDKEPEDQKLERGNLALKNSILKKNEVRVIRGVKDTKPLDERRKVSTTYTYFGLYTVERYWQEIGHHGKKEYKFELKRVPGQRDLPWKEVKNSKKFKIREGRCVSDISAGKEQFPICAVNIIDDEKPPLFTYISRMTYTGCKPLRPQGCDCTNGCSYPYSTHCSCLAKTGGGIQYNNYGAIIEAKPLVYECGPSCKCPPSCHNRVSQHGIKFQLEIFKTESRGWGVRSLSSIPSGSFICEYTGELLEDTEAEKRTGNDEYLFDIGQNCNDHSVWDGLASLIPDASSSTGEVVADSGFTIDAAKCGNVGRFINHSCSPNLYAQNVLYDHADTRMPHIMLFAVENIPPLKELTYHYNYKIGQVYDKHGNVKVKNCYCGSANCSGRMY